MWQWIANVTGWGILNVGGTVSQWVRDIIHGLWGWLSSVFNHVGDAWSEIWQSGNAIWLSVQHFGLANLAVLWHIINKQIPRVFEWAFNHFKDLLAFANRIWRDLNQWVAQLIQRIKKAIDDLTRWVIVHVWTPLKNDFLQAWHWITTNGALVLFYITHPDKLAALIFDSLIHLLEREAWNVAPVLGKFFLALILHNAKRFLILLEDIVSAVL